MDDTHREVLQACAARCKGGTFMPHDVVADAVPHKDQSGIQRQLDIGACIYNLEKDEYLTWNILAGMKVWSLTEAGEKALGVPDHEVLPYPDEETTCESS